MTIARRHPISERNASNTRRKLYQQTCRSGNKQLKIGFFSVTGYSRLKLSLPKLNISCGISGCLKMSLFSLGFPLSTVKINKV
jgi:hypothetical protein